MRLTRHRRVDERARLHRLGLFRDAVGGAISYVAGQLSMTNASTNPTDWLAYMEAWPHMEPYMSIAKAWREDKAEIERLTAALTSSEGTFKLIEAENELLRVEVTKWRERALKFADGGAVQLHSIEVKREPTGFEAFVDSLPPLRLCSKCERNWISGTEECDCDPPSIA
jgi:hypothetical protein